MKVAQADQTQPVDDIESAKNENTSDLTGIRLDLRKLWVLLLLVVGLNVLGACFNASTLGMVVGWQGAAQHTKHEELTSHQSFPRVTPLDGRVSWSTEDKGETHEGTVDHDEMVQALNSIKSGAREFTYSEEGRIETVQIISFDELAVESTNGTWLTLQSARSGDQIIQNVAILCPPAISRGETQCHVFVPQDGAVNHVHLGTTVSRGELYQLRILSVANGPDDDPPTSNGTTGHSEDSRKLRVWDGDYNWGGCKCAPSHQCVSWGWHTQWCYTSEWTWWPHWRARYCVTKNLGYSNGRWWAEEPCTHPQQEEEEDSDTQEQAETTADAAQSQSRRRRPRRRR